MTTLLLLRREAAAARQTQAAIEATRDMRVAAVVSTLSAARRHITQFAPDVLVTDLSLDDGAAISLLVELRRSGLTRERPKVMLVTPSANDVLLFGSISAGADSFILDDASAGQMVTSLRRMVLGEAAMNASLALQVLGLFGVTTRANPTVNERTLDWSRGAADPLQLSRGEQHLLALLAQGEAIGGVAVRLALSIESVGRRISNIYRKLQWDLRSGSLALHAG